MRDRMILRAVYGEPWALLPAKLAVIADVVRFHAAGGKMSSDMIALTMGSPAPGSEMAVVRANSRASGNVAVLPLFGIIHQRMNMMMEFSGGTSTEMFGAAFRQAVADPNVKAIVLNVDSPGGGVSGVPELAAEIMAARESKPVIAQVNSMMASAAYWIGSAASEIVITPGGMAGSIGVYTAHQDMSAADAAAGVKTTLISAGKYKTEGNPFEPLTEEGLAALQSTVDEYYSLFVAAVAKGRGVPVSAVRGGFGEGRMVGAREAVALKMADRVGTLRETLQRFGATPEQARLMDSHAEEDREFAAVSDYAAQSVREDLEIRQRRLRLHGG